MTAGSTFAQGKEGANQPPFREINLNLTEGIVNQPLPFDVPFILTGSVPNTVISVKAYLQRATAAPPPEPGALQPVQGVNCNGIDWSTLNPIATWVVPPASALPATGTAPATARTRTFRLLFPAIEVNTSYCTHFEMERQVSARDATEFRTKAAAAIDTVLRTLGLEAGNLTRDEIEALRQRLITAITATNSGIRAMPGTLFDSRPVDTMSEEELQRAQTDLSDRLTLVLQAQNQRIQQIDNYVNDVQNAFAVANSIRADAFMLGNAEALIKQLPPNDGTTFRQVLSGQSTDLVATITGLTPAQARSGADPRNVVGGIWSATTTDPCDVKEIAGMSASVNNTAALFLAVLTPLEAPAFVKTLKPPDNKQRQALVAQVKQLLSYLVGAREALNNVQQRLCDRAVAIEAIALVLRTEVQDEVTLLVTTTGDFATRHTWYFSVDVGLAVAPVIGEVFPYVGINIYFRPVNKEAPLSSLSNTFSRRFSAMIGYTWTDNLLKDNERLGIFTRDNAVGVSVENQDADAMLVFGAGLRVTDALRLAGGALLFKSEDPNPLITDTKLQVTPFFSMSFDWDAVGSIKGLGGLMGLGGTPVPVKIGAPNPPPANEPEPEEK
jgi:hypothetical protein